MSTCISMFKELWWIGLRCRSTPSYWPNDPTNREGRHFHQFRFVVSLDVQSIKFVQKPKTADDLHTQVEVKPKASWKSRYHEIFKISSFFSFGFGVFGIVSYDLGAVVEVFMWFQLLPSCMELCRARRRRPDFMEFTEDLKNDRTTKWQMMMFLLWLFCPKEKSDAKEKNEKKSKSTEAEDDDEVQRHFGHSMDDRLR